MTSPWQRFLRDFKIEDLLGTRSTEELKVDMLNHIVFLSKEDTVKEAINILTTNKLIAVPVYDEENNQFIGFVDMLDLATLCVAHFDQPNPSTSKFEDLHIRSVVDLSGRDTWLPLERTAPLHDLFSFLSKPHVHRVPIIDPKEKHPEKKVLAIITQGEVIRWLWTSRVNVGFPVNALLMKVRDISSVRKFSRDGQLVLIQENRTVVEALRKIVQNKVNGLGVVSASGELVGNVSASDLKVIAAAGWQQLTGLLAQPLHDFLKFKGTFMLNLRDHASHPVPITVDLDDTLEIVLFKLATKHVHRVWVVENESPQTGTGADAKEARSTPVGCITLTDVIHELTQFSA